MDIKKVPTTNNQPAAAKSPAPKPTSKVVPSSPTSSAKPAPVATVPAIKPAGKATITVGTALSTAKDNITKTPPKPGYVKPTNPVEVTTMPSASRTKAAAPPNSATPKAAAANSTTPKPSLGASMSAQVAGKSNTSKTSPVTNTMPHKSHFGLGVGIAIVVLGLAAGGIYAFTGGLKNPLARTINKQQTQSEQSYKEAETELQQLEADLKDVDGRFNDQPGDLTEN